MLSRFAQSLSFERFLTYLFLLVILVSACLMPAQSDTWWQLRTGEEMWKSHHVMLRDEFTHTVAGGYWPNHEWLAQLIFYAAYAVGGLPLLTALCAAAITICWAFIADLTPIRGVARILLLGLGAIGSSASWSLRPQVFTAAFLAATIWIVVRRRWLWSLPPLFLLWANLHGAVALGGFVVCAGVIATAMVDRSRLREMLSITFACFVCTALTPLGVSLWWEIPHSLARLHSYGVLEWQPPGLFIPDLPFWIAAGAGFILLFMIRAEFRGSWTTAVLGTTFAIFFVLASQSRRNIPSFVLCTIPVIATALSSLGQRRAEHRRERPMLNTAVLTSVASVGILAVAVAWSRPIDRLGWRPVPSGLQRALTDCRGQLYNRYDEGGYLIWFVREKKVFIDSRQDPFPADMVQSHIRLEMSGDYREVFSRYHIGCALAADGSPLAARLASDGWQPASTGGTWTVFSRGMNTP